MAFGYPEQSIGGSGSKKTKRFAQYLQNSQVGAGPRGPDCSVRNEGHRAAACRCSHVESVSLRATSQLILRLSVLAAGQRESPGAHRPEHCSGQHGGCDPAQVTVTSQLTEDVAIEVCGLEGDSGHHKSLWENRCRVLRSRAKGPCDVTPNFSAPNPNSVPRLVSLGCCCCDLLSLKGSWAVLLDEAGLGQAAREL